ncbi:glycosyltransferase [Phocaeicola barnesiae]|uniref:glycosyltransferase n=1 Tax=Phocaeicola barnesiae TaxID=376804 RepID=UPI00266F078F|nr:glycosyltransferase [Phocaeicola barnesiae]
MKVLQSGSLDIKSGGPALSTYLTLKGLKENGVSAEIVMPPLRKGGKLIADDIDVHYTLVIRNRRFGYMPKLTNTLQNLGKYDLYHIQGIWQYLGHGVASYARKNKKPYIVTLRGMMYPQALAHSAIIKKISLLLYQRKDLSQAACIQATCIEEMNYYRSLGFMNPVAVLPNPIEVANIIDRPIRTNSCFRIGYLGRIHSRKRIERLIYAFYTLRNELHNAELLIIGADDQQYEEFLHKEVERLQLKNIHFTGFLTGKEKDEAIMSLSYLVVPSDFENFGNIVTEALVRGVPVIASKGMPWQELEDYHCGWWIDNDQETINRTIMKAYETSEMDRIQMGMNGKRLMKEKYAVDVLGLKMKQLYEWILYGGTKPDFVYE